MQDRLACVPNRIVRVQAPPLDSASCDGKCSSLVRMKSFLPEKKENSTDFNWIVKRGEKREGMMLVLRLFFPCKCIKHHPFLGREMREGRGVQGKQVYLLCSNVARSHTCMHSRGAATMKRTVGDVEGEMFDGKFDLKRIRHLIRLTLQRESKNYLIHPSQVIKFCNGDFSREKAL